MEPTTDPAASRVEARVLKLLEASGGWMSKSAISHHTAHRDRLVLAEVLQSMEERGTILSLPGPRTKSSHLIAINTPEAAAQHLSAQPSMLF